MNKTAEYASLFRPALNHGQRTVLEPIADDVDLFTSIDQRRQRAAKVRLHFASAARKAQDRDKMGRALCERLARRAFGVDDVVALKFDVIVFKLAHVAGIMQRNRCPIHEAAGAHQHAVRKDAVLLRHVQIRVRHVGGPAPNARREQATHRLSKASKHRSW